MIGKEISLEIYITTWKSQTGSLFDYKTEDYQEIQQFKAVMYHLTFTNKHPAYLFFHQPKIQQRKYMVLLEHRKRPISQMDSEKSEKYSLIGGAQITYHPDTKQPYLKALSPQEIQIKEVYGRYPEEKGQLRPFWVVRSFPQGQRLKVGQHLQMGRQEFAVEEIHLGGMQLQNYVYKSEEILNLDDIIQESRMSAKQRVQSEEKRQCRFCYGEQDEIQNPLISPCDCKGSTGLVHIECLQKWVITKMKSLKSVEEGGMYELSKLFCQICRKRFPKMIIKNGKRFSLLSFLQNDTSAYVQIQVLEKDLFPSSDPYANLVGQEKMYITFQDQKQVLIGRQEDNGVLLTDGSVSRKHARLELHGDKIVIQDRESKYGTLLLDEEKKVKLKKDRMRAFQIGPVAFCFTRKTVI